MDKKEIGRRICLSRKEKDKTLQDIADDIGLAKSTIQRYESGGIENIKLPVIEAIARNIGVNPAWILGKSEIKESDHASLADHKTNNTKSLPDGIVYKGKLYTVENMPLEAKPLLDYIEKTFLQE